MIPYHVQVVYLKTYTYGKNYLKNIKTFRFVLFGSILYHELKN